MNYEQKYKEALARANEQLVGAKVFDNDNKQIAHDIRTTVYNIFPELKESNGDRIRKGIIKSIMDLSPDWLELHGVKKEDAVAWLEKQGNNADKVKQQQTIEIPFGAKDSELQEATYHIPEGYHAEINGNEVVIKKGKQKTT